MKSTTCPAPRRWAWARLLSLGAGVLALNLTTANAATTCNTIYASVGTNTGWAATGSYLATLSPTGQLGNGVALPFKPGSTSVRSVTAGIGIDPVNNRLLYIDGSGGAGYGATPTYARIYEWNGTNPPTEITVDATRSPIFTDPTSEHQAGVDKAGVLWATRWNGAKTLYKWNGTGNAMPEVGAIAGPQEWTDLTDGDMAFDGVFDGIGTGRMWFASSNTSGQIVIYRVTRNPNNTFTAVRIAGLTSATGVPVTPSTTNNTTGNYVSGLAFEPNSTRLFIATTGGDVYTYDIETGVQANLTTNAGSVIVGGVTARAITDLGSCAYPQPDLGITKTHSGDFQVWQPGTYTLTITNSGLLSTTRPIQIRDVLPTGMTFAGASSSGGTVTGPAAGTSGAITLSFTPTTPIKPGESRTVTLNVNVGLTAAGNSVNYASVGDGGDSFGNGVAPTPGAGCASHCASDPTTILPPNPASISKAFTPTTVLLNGTSTITFTLSNPNTGGPLTNLNFTDTLTGMSVASNGIGGTCAATSNPALTAGATSLNLTVPTLAAGASCTVTVTVKGTQVGVHPNTASGVSSTETPTPGAQSNTVNLIVTAADVGVTKTGPLYAKPATDVTYTLTVTNSGSAAAATVTLSDTLPVGLTYISSSPAATVSGQTLTWTLGTLVMGDSRTITVTVKAPSEDTLIGTAAARKLTNTASVSSSTVETASANNTSSVTTEMIAAKLTKSVQNVTQNTAVGTTGGGRPGEVLEYCIAFENIGAVALPNFVVTDHVPGNTNAQAGGYDADELSAATGFGVKLTRSTAKPTTSYLTSGADGDAGSLSSSGGSFGRGTMSVNLGSLAVGEQGSACFRTAIR